MNVEAVRRSIDSLQSDINQFKKSNKELKRVNKKLRAENILLHDVITANKLNNYSRTELENGCNKLT